MFNPGRIPDPTQRVLRRTSASDRGVAALGGVSPIVHAGSTVAFTPSSGLVARSGGSLGNRRVGQMTHVAESSLTPPDYRYSAGRAFGSV
jgi:hypothetical protein